MYVPKMSHTLVQVTTMMTTKGLHMASEMESKVVVELSPR